MQFIDFYARSQLDKSVSTLWLTQLLEYFSILKLYDKISNKTLLKASIADFLIWCLAPGSSLGVIISKLFFFYNTIVTF